MSTTSMPTRETLERTADLLQRAHDRIEAVGFDIDVYGSRGDWVRYEPACYIGTVRGALGLDGSPDCVYNPVLDVYVSTPAAGDGPELVLALEYMDRVAKRRFPRFKREAQKVEAQDRAETGRFVEQLGFLVRQRAQDRFPHQLDRQEEYETAYALKLLRAALAELYR